MPASDNARAHKLSTILEKIPTKVQRARQYESDMTNNNIDMLFPDSRQTGDTIGGWGSSATLGPEIRKPKNVNAVRNENSWTLPMT